MLLASTDGTLHAANRAAEQQFGVPPGGLSGRSLSDYQTGPPGALLDYLKLCTRTRDLVPGALHDHDPGGAAGVPGRRGVVSAPDRRHGATGVAPAGAERYRDWPVHRAESAHRRPLARDHPSPPGRAGIIRAARVVPGPLEEHRRRGDRHRPGRWGAVHEPRRRAADRLAAGRGLGPAAPRGLLDRQRGHPRRRSRTRPRSSSARATSSAWPTIPCCWPGTAPSGPSTTPPRRSGARTAPSGASS